MKISLNKIILFSIILLIVVALFFIFVPAASVYALLDSITAAGSRETLLDSLFDIYFIFVVVSTLLYAITFFLGWASQIGLYFGEGALTYVFIDVGWTWALGMVNMFFVIAFTLAALLYILDVDIGIVNKKTMPKLIIIALLVNFSLLFVQIITDFFIILQNSVGNQIMPGGLPRILATVRLETGIMIILVGLPLLLKKTIGKILDLLIIKPFLGWKSWMVKWFTKPIFIFPIIIGAFTNALLFIVFFIYTILFLMQSIMIAVLAAVAPFAFFALAFPNTKKYFDGWLKQLIIWGIMGTIITFTLGFGFHMRAIVAGEGIGGVIGALFTPWLPGLFFAIYAIISLFLIKRFLPSAAQGVINMAQKGAMVAAGVGGGMLAAGTIKKWGSGAQEKLSKYSDKRGRSSFMGRMAGGASEKLQKQTEKIEETEQNRYKTASRETKLKDFKVAKEEGNKTTQAALIKSMNSEGERFTKKDADEIGLSYGDIKKATGSEYFNEKLKPFSLAFGIEKDQADIKINEGKLNNPNLLGEEKGEIQTKIEKGKQSIKNRVGNADPKDLQPMLINSPELYDNEQIQEAIKQKTPRDIRTIVGNNDKIIKAMAQKELKDTESPEDFEKTFRENKNLIEALSELHDVNISPGMVKDAIDGKASDEQIANLMNETYSSLGMTKQIEKSNGEKISPLKNKIDEIKIQNKELERKKIDIGAIGGIGNSEYEKINDQIKKNKDQMGIIKKGIDQIEIINKELIDRSKNIDKIEKLSDAI